MDITSADPRTVIRLRRGCISYVSQFLRVIPRVSTLDLVAEPLLEAGEGQAAARRRAEGLLARLNLPDEPTASLDGANRQVVIDLIREARGDGAAIVGIFHDDVAREAVADRTIPVRRP